MDGQNLYIGTTLENESWKIDFYKFRKYLEVKYQVSKAFYYIGTKQEKYSDIYKHLRAADFILKFREHHNKMLGKKKGNIDVDIVFDIMKDLYFKEKFDSVFLVSGDGDYFRLVSFLIKQRRFKKNSFS